MRRVNPYTSLMFMAQPSCTTSPTHRALVRGCACATATIGTKRTTTKATIKG
jgi:hypothetical protein